MDRILVPVDLGAELSEKAELKEFRPPRNSPFSVDIRVYKFGIAVLDFTIETPSENISKCILPNGQTFGRYRKAVEKYVLDAVKPF